MLYRGEWLLESLQVVSHTKCARIPRDLGMTASKCQIQVATTPHINRYTHLLTSSSKADKYTRG